MVKIFNTGSMPDWDLRCSGWGESNLRPVSQNSHQDTGRGDHSIQTRSVSHRPPEPGPLAFQHLFVFGESCRGLSQFSQ